MSLINGENVIRISKGFMKNYLIPTYRMMLPYRHNELKSLSSTSDFIYGKHAVIGTKRVKDIWKEMPGLINGTISLTYSQPNDHQDRQYSFNTYNKICSISLPTFNGKDFEKLYDLIYNTFFAKSFPLAFLTSYDMAYRVAYNLYPNCLPNKYVYLAAGSYLGAAKLFGEKWIDNNEDKKFKQRKEGYFARVKRSKFFYMHKGCRIDYFDKLSSAEVEDMLCIFFDIHR